MLKTFLLILIISALYPLQYLAHNISYFSTEASVLGLSVSFLFTLLLFGICWGMVRDTYRACIAALLATLLFWGFGAIASFVMSRGTRESTQSQYWLLALIASVIIFGFAFYRLSIPWLATRNGRAVCWVFLASMTALPLTTIGHEYGRRLIEDHFVPATIKKTAAAGAPDIYYIIMDAYGRNDILRSIYHYDNSPFTEFLEKKGFYVAHDSHSNYGQTLLSLASSLNLDYLTALYQKMPATSSRDKTHLSERVRHSLVQDIVQKNGYRFVVINSGYKPTKIKDADVVINPKPHFNDQNREFLLSLLDDSPLSVISTVFDPKDENHTKDYIENQLQTYFSNELNPMDSYALDNVFRFNSLRRTVSLPGPKFVFAHIISPHPPFVFTHDDDLENYTPKNSAKRFFAHDGSEYVQNRPDFLADYISRYPEQVAYVNRQLESFVEQVLSERPNSIIIIQGDHGPGSHLDNESFENTNVYERFSILNSYYFPDRDYQHLSPAISPVNSFRVVFNKLFGMNYPMLPYQGFYAPYGLPFNFHDATGLLLDPHH